MKKFIAILSAVCGLFMLGFFGQNNHVQAAEKTYTIDTDVTFPPFVYANTQNKYVGIDIELLKAIAKEEGFKVNIRPVGFNAAVQSVTAGQADGMIAGMSITEERKQKFDFSDPYYSAGIVMAVKEGSGIKSLSELKGKRVAVKTGTAGADYANSIKDKYGFEVVTFDDSDSVYNDVINGNSAACFEDSAVMSYAIKNGLGLKVVTKPTNTTQVGFAVKKGENQELLKMFNEGLAKLKANGQYEKIIKKYTSGTATSATKAKDTSSSSSSEDRTVMGILKENKSAFISGILETLKLTVVGIFCATIFGVLIGLLGVLPNKFCRGLSTTIIYIFRGLPLIVLALFIYNGVPTLIGTKVPAFLAGVITLMLNAAV